MRKVGLLVAGTLCIAGALGCAKSREAAPAPSVAVTQSSGPGEASQAITATATVEDVDVKNRLVTLRTADGESTQIKVGEEVRNLPQVRKGDIVTATFYESIALSCAKRRVASRRVGLQGMGCAARVHAVRTAVRTTTLTAKVIGVDRKKRSASRTAGWTGHP
jgi:hypothetical protein